MRVALEVHKPQVIEHVAREPPGIIQLDFCGDEGRSNREQPEKAASGLSNDDGQEEYDHIVGFEPKDLEGLMDILGEFLLHFK